jgi:hypothetical protein
LFAKVCNLRNKWWPLALLSCGTMGKNTIYQNWHPCRDTNS